MQEASDLKPCNSFYIFYFYHESVIKYLNYIHFTVYIMVDW